MAAGDVKALAVAVNGVAQFDLKDAIQVGDKSSLVLTCDGYLPFVMPLPEVAGTYDVSMTEGRTLSFEVTDARGEPVAHARVVLFTNNVARHLIDSYDGDSVPGASFSAGPGRPWLFGGLAATLASHHARTE